MSSFRDRVARVIQVVFDGSTNAAAEAAAIPTSTLHRIVERKVSAPRLDTVTLLADRFGVPLGWLTGEMSTIDAQASANSGAEYPTFPLPEEFWLVYAFQRSRQRKTREWLRSTAGKNRTASRMIAEFLDFRFEPMSDDFAITAIRDLLANDDPIPAADIAIVRTCAELETAILENAVQKIKRLNAEAERGK